MGYVLALFAILLLILAGYYGYYWRLEMSGKRDLPLLSSDPGAFYEKWHRIYRRSRLPAGKRFALFLSVLALFRQGKTDKAAELSPFLQRGLLVDQNAVAALRETILRASGNSVKADEIQKNDPDGISAGRKSIWLQ